MDYAESTVSGRGSLVGPITEFAIPWVESDALGGPILVCSLFMTRVWMGGLRGAVPGPWFGWMDGWMDGWMFGWMDSWMDG